MRASDGATSAWRFFPLAIIGGIGLTVAVNATMVWSAVATFPGKAGRDGFELSNRYNAVLDQEARQAKLGWSVRAEADAKGRPVLTVTDASGQPFGAARVEAIASRPLGAEQTTPLVFVDHGGGRFVADQALGLSGQWDLTITTATGGRGITVTRRVHVP